MKKAIWVTAAVALAFNAVVWSAVWKQHHPDALPYGAILIDGTNEAQIRSALHTRLAEQKTEAQRKEKPSLQPAMPRPSRSPGSPMLAWRKETGPPPCFPICGEGIAMLTE